MRNKPLDTTARLAALLGFLSISLTGEISPAWMVAMWSAWAFSFASDRLPEFQAAVRRLETAAVIGMVGLLFIDFFLFRNTIFIAVTHFLIFFQMVKLAGEKARKDCLQIFLFSFFQILAACTLSVDAWHAVVLIGFIPTAATALFWNQMAREREETGIPLDPGTERNYRRIAAGVGAIAFPLNITLTLLVFVIFPRVTINARLPGFSGGRAGYTDQINLAQTGTLSEDAAVVLWLAFPRPEDRNVWDGYLRGEVLNTFNGRQWSSSGGHQRSLNPDLNGIFTIRPHQPSAHLLRAAITLADTSAATLFTTGRPIRVLAPLPALQENEEGTLHWNASWRRPLRYEVISEPLIDTEVRTTYLDLPSLSLERIRNLARQVAGHATPLAQAERIETFLRKSYRYSNDYGRRVAENPVESFLFERRQGNCGHFASAMALMLRLQKIPSRVVAGYYKGEWNEPAQCVVVRGRHAHAWVEAYIAGKGWVSFDPTPTPVEGGFAHKSLAHELQQYWDYLSYQWNRLVIQYDLYSQIKAFETVKGTWWPNFRLRWHHPQRAEGGTAESGTDSRKRIPWKELGVMLFLGVVAISSFARRRGPAPDAPIRFYNRFLHQMARAGHPKAPHETGREYAARLTKEQPEWNNLARELTEKYYVLRFRKGTP